MIEESPQALKYCGIIIFLSALLVFFYQLSNFTKVVFDEFHYVPAAKEWLDMAPTRNLEHPPVGKYLIAGGIKIFGDNALGWRAASALSGALSILLCFLIAQQLFHHVYLALSVGLFGLFNFWFYVQSRIAMLDIFMVTFFLAGVYFFLQYKREIKDQRPSSQKCFFVLSALSLGLAMAVKWSAIFIYFPFLLLMLFPLNPFLKKLKEVVAFGLLSTSTYFLTYIPYLYVSGNYRRSVFEILFKLPEEMLNLQKSVGGTHPYSSEWYTWPFMIRPIWYEYVKVEGSDYFRGMVLLGNPFQMAIGFLAALFCLFQWKKLGARAQGTLFLFLCSWLSWAVAPRKISFFYYFFPSAIFYSFLVPMALRQLFKEERAFKVMVAVVAVSAVFFEFFYPILSGSEALEATRLKWQWLEGWV